MRLLDTLDYNLGGAGAVRPSSGCGKSGDPRWHRRVRRTIAQSTARFAYDCGYHVVLITNAMADFDIAAPQNTIDKIFPRLGETTTTEFECSGTCRWPRPTRIAQA